MDNNNWRTHNDSRRNGGHDYSVVVVMMITAVINHAARNGDKHHDTGQ